MRVWKYEVRASEVDAFVAAYGPSGTWAELFARAKGYAGTRLFRDVDRPGQFLTVDRWADAACWETFLARWGNDYRDVDERLNGLAAGGEVVVEGSN